MPEPKSLIALSMHKAGSTIADQILVDFCTARGYEIDQIALQVPASPLPEAEVYINYQPEMKSNGVYYGIARGAYVQDMPTILNLSTIVQVRDPRDCITSAYFSFGKSHVPPRDPGKLKAFLKDRESINEMTIDQFARTMSANYRKRMKILTRIIDAHDDILVLKYEDMVEDTERWLGRISAFIGQPVTPELRGTLGRKIDFSVAQEDETRHKRQIRPGDHARKLKPETITAMNAVLGGMLARFDYAA